MKNKKGSMELGINAIVILIIALAMLGLGIGFITKLIGGGQEKLGGLIEATSLPVHASSDAPFMLDPSNIEVKSGNKFEVTVVIYNTLNSEAKVNLEITDCIDESSTSLYFTATGQPLSYVAADVIEIVSAERIIGSGNEGGFKALIKSGSSVKKGTYICTIAATMTPTSGSDSSETMSQQIFVNVYK